jgi:hypothetical protein
MAAPVFASKIHLVLFSPLFLLMTLFKEFINPTQYHSPGKILQGRYMFSEVDFETT